MRRVNLIPLIFVFIFSFSLACDCEPSQFTPGQPTNFTWVVLNSSSSNVSYATHPPTNCTLLWENMSKIGELNYNGSGIFYYTLNLTNESDSYKFIVNCTDGNYTSSVMCTTEIIDYESYFPFSIILIGMGFIIISYILRKGYSYIRLLSILFMAFSFFLFLSSIYYMVNISNSEMLQLGYGVITSVIIIFSAIVVIEILLFAINKLKEIIKMVGGKKR